jgi:hypothetical protein
MSTREGRAAEDGVGRGKAKSVVGGSDHVVSGFETALRVKRALGQ